MVLMASSLIHFAFGNKLKILLEAPVTTNLFSQKTFRPRFLHCRFILTY